MDQAPSHGSHSGLEPQSGAPVAQPTADVMQPPARVLPTPPVNGPHPASLDTASAAGFDIESLVTEDDTPVDNMPSEKQQRLLTEPLYTSWPGPGSGRTFLAAANVGVFPEPRNPAIVPDVFLSLDVQVADNWWDKAHRSYFVWEFGKPPDLVLEIVSNREGNEDGSKKLRYARMGVGCYVIYDPRRRVMPEVLRVYRLRGAGYERQPSPRFPALRLGLTLWDGEFESVRSRWLRWTDEHDALIPMGKDHRQRAERAEHLLAEERQRAQQVGRRAEKLAALLRRSGIDPDQE